jgi:DNA-binding NarL/FixJ family response regulator
MATRILIADDHEIVLEGIRTLLARSRREWEICGEARNGKDAVEMAKTLKPDIAILDVTMPGMSGLQAASEIVKSSVGCKVLIFTMHESTRLEIEVRSAGAQGYVLKSQAARDLVRAIDALLAGGTFYGPSAEGSKAEKEKTNPSARFRLTLAFA